MIIHGDDRTNHGQRQTRLEKRNHYYSELAEQSLNQKASSIMPVEY